MRSASSEASGWRRAICGALALAALLAAGCGSGEGEERAQAEEEIRSVLIENLTAGGDADIECADTVTEAYVERLYGSKEECRDLADASTGDSSTAEPEEIEFEAIEVEGTDANVQVAVTSGDFEGIEGGASMVEDPDRDWLFDDFDGDLARSSVLVSLRSESDLPEPLVDCIEDELFGPDADDEEVKEVYADLVSEEQGAAEEIVAAGEACAAPPPQGGGGSGGGGNGNSGGGSGSVDPSDINRKDFEKDLRENLIDQQGLSEAVADCAIKRLRRTLSDKEIATIIESAQQGRQPQAKIIQKLNRAGAACTRSESKGNRA